jgi:prepilin-type N-terminal cleavage/methylation domain-containing protein
MTTKRLKFLFSLLKVNSEKHKSAGFTLIELLVALIITSLIISSLLGLVVDILQADRDESAFNETQREMQIALNYISRELREAVYVYDANCLLTGQGTPPSGTAASSQDFCPRLTNHLPKFDGMTPILAFWKPEEIKDNEMPANTINPTTGVRTCTGIVAPSTQQDCQDLLVKRRTHTLVVYLQSTSNPVNRWSGKSRIVRYALSKYRNPKTLAISRGYVDPYVLEEGRNFQNWPIDPNRGTSLQAETPDNQADVLVDFVDTPTTNLAEDKIPFLSCPRNAVAGTPPGSDDYIRTPPAINIPPTTNNSFYACVRRTIVVPPPVGGTAVATGGLTNVNQDVILYLRGNAFGKNGIRNDRNFRPILQTQVLVRGVIDSNPE